MKWLGNIIYKSFPLQEKFSLDLSLQIVHIGRRTIYGNPAKYVNRPNCSGSKPIS